MISVVLKMTVNPRAASPYAEPTVAPEITYCRNAEAAVIPT